MQYTSQYTSPLGNITLASNGEALIGVWFDKQKYFASTLKEESKEMELPVFFQTKQWLDCYFAGKDPGDVPPIHLEGSPFRLSVWKILQEIPYGQVVTYNDIAQKIARQKGLTHMSAQAVGGAVGHNPISILIPCHRVIGSNGSLTGYAGGIAIKEKLLLLEGVTLNR